MKKLATYIMAGFLSVGVASPAFSEVNCGLAKDVTIGAIKDWVRVTKLMELSGVGQMSPKVLRVEQQDLVRTMDAFSNVYNTFCK